MIRAIVFDAYGTLFDVQAVAAGCEAAFPGRGEEISRLWRQKQLEYSWLRSLMGQYTGFGQVTRDALAWTLEALGETPGPGTLEALANAYRQLPPYPEVPDALEALAEYRLAILSNGEAEMLAATVRSAGLAAALPTILSADAAGRYKPDPVVYRLCTKTLGLEAAEILFVSANAWDVAGAKAFGFRVGRVNRAGLPMERLGLATDLTAPDLLALAALLTAQG